MGQSLYPDSAAWTTGKPIATLPNLSEGSDMYQNLHADVFVPQRRVVADERSHQFDAPRVLQHLDDHAAAFEQRFLAQECLVFADDDARDLVKQNGSAAHRARR